MNCIVVVVVLNLWLLVLVLDILVILFPWIYYILIEFEHHKLNQNWIILVYLILCWCLLNMLPVYLVYVIVITEVWVSSRIHTSQSDVSFVLIELPCTN